MFFINTIRHDDQRCVGYFRFYAEAHEKVMKNCGDMFEDGYYKYACICKMGQGLYRSLIEVQWFGYDAETRSVTTISKPEELNDFQQYIIG